MSNVMTAAGEGQPQQQIIALTGTAYITSEQVRTCLSALAQLNQVMDVHDPEDFRPRHVDKYDGGLKVHLEQSAMNILGRLDRLFENDELWPTASLEAQNAVTLKKYSEVRLQQVEEELKFSRNKNRPCVTYGAAVRVQGSTFTVSIGDINDPEKSLVGRGPTIELAMQNFDDLARQIQPQ